jgi:hypothetical protein
VPPDRPVVLRHGRRHDRAGRERAQPPAVGLLARAEPGDDAIEAAERVGQRGRRRLVREERVEPEAVEGPRPLHEAPVRQEPPEPRLARERDRAARRRRAHRPQRGYGLQHVAQRARMDDQRARFHLTAGRPARSIQPP